MVSWKTGGLRSLFLVLFIFLVFGFTLVLVEARPNSAQPTISVGSSSGTGGGSTITINKTFINETSTNVSLNSTTCLARFVNLTDVKNTEGKIDVKYASIGVGHDIEVSLTKDGWNVAQFCPKTLSSCVTSPRNPIALCSAETSCNYPSANISFYSVKIQDKYCSNVSSIYRLIDMAEFCSNRKINVTNVSNINGLINVNYNSIGVGDNIEISVTKQGWNTSAFCPIISGGCSAGSGSSVISCNAQTFCNYPSGEEGNYTIKVKDKKCSNVYSDYYFNIKKPELCFDSDNGDYYKNGTTYLGHILGFDVCLNNKLLSESKCLGNKIVHEDYICPEECRNGACIRTCESHKINITNVQDINGKIYVNYNNINVNDILVSLTKLFGGKNSSWQLCQLGVSACGSTSGNPVVSCGAQTSCDYPTGENLTYIVRVQDKNCSNVYSDFPFYGVSICSNRIINVTSVSNREGWINVNYKTNYYKLGTNDVEISLAKEGRNNISWQLCLPSIGGCTGSNSSFIYCNIKTLCKYPSNKESGNYIIRAKYKDCSNVYSDYFLYIAPRAPALKCNDTDGDGVCVQMLSPMNKSEVLVKGQMYEIKWLQNNVSYIVLGYRSLNDLGWIKLNIPVNFSKTEGSYLWNVSVMPGFYEKNLSFYIVGSNEFGRWHAEESDNYFRVVESKPSIVYPGSWCNDSDGGINPYKKGYIQGIRPAPFSDSLYTLHDYCDVYGPFSRDYGKPFVMERYCNGTIDKFVNVPCPKGCKDGACIE
jgi:hypothetical protein